MTNDPDAPAISVLDLARALEYGEPLQIVDVRAPTRVQQGRIDLVHDSRFHNIVGSTLIAYNALDGTGIDPSLPVVVVCGHGHDSKRLALHLNAIGCRARSLTGGLSAWMRVAMPRALQPPPSLDQFVQFDRLGKGALGYLLVSDGQALVVDPPLEASSYLEAAADRGARIVGVADTHVHADYVSGATKLARALGVPYHLHAADSFYAYDGTPGRLESQAIRDGSEIRFGRCAARVQHTPGHTEGSVTYLVDDEIALTGDFLFVGSIGRPDLAGKTAEWTAQLWRSVERAKREWPSTVRIYPAHYGGDAERNADRSVGAPFGQLLQANPSLQFSTREPFAAWVESKNASFPEAYKRIKAVNVALVDVTDEEAEELEIGRNECALGGR